MLRSGDDVTNVTIAHEDEQIKAHKKYILLRCGDPSLDHTENIWNLNGIGKYMDMNYLLRYKKQIYVRNGNARMNHCDMIQKMTLV